ncbi:MAG: ADP-ribosylglycohydrolase family protein, partial [Bacteroidota bacterium]
MNERVKASLLIGALGDAFGSRFEQMDVPANNERWSFSDDTQLTMATCEAIMEAGRPTAEQVSAAFKRWYRSGQLTGLGAATLKALVELVGGAAWGNTGTAGEHSAGNGAAMRIAPLAFLLDPMLEADRETIRDICQITHQNEEAYVGALAVVYAIRFIQNDRQNFIHNIIRQLPDSEVSERLIQISHQPGLSIREIGRKFGKTGHVVDSVPLALFAAQQAPDIGLRKMMKELVALGGDTDTNCSI